MKEHPLIRCLRRERIPFPRLICSLPILAIYDIAHSLPVGGVHMNFLFSGMRPIVISHLNII